MNDKYNREKAFNSKHNGAVTVAIRASLLARKEDCPGANWHRLHSMLHSFVTKTKAKSKMSPEEIERVKTEKRRLGRSTYVSTGMDTHH